MKQDPEELIFNAAHLFARAAILRAVVEGMTAENQIRLSMGHALAYDERAFVSCVTDTFPEIVDPKTKSVCLEMMGNLGRGMDA